MDWLETKNNSPLVVILHGLGSSAQDHHVQSLIKEIEQMGWQALAINARGMSGENRLPKTSYGGQTEDLDWVVKQIIKRKKADQIYMVGYSIGGNQVLKWLGEKGENIPKEVKKAAAISVSYDLQKAAHNLDQGFNRQVYTRLLLKGLKEKALVKEKHFPRIINREKVRKAATFQVYDREVTARVNGFKDEYDYWAQSSSIHYLDRIRCLVLLIHAQNDTFLPGKDLPLEKIKNSRYLRLMLTKDGGHLGFVSGKFPFQRDRWLEKTILRFLKENDAANR